MRDTDNLSAVTSVELHECDVWAGYVGGEVVKVWPDDWWKRVSQFPKLPIYGARQGKTGTFCGLETIMALYKLGVPPGTAVALDAEILSNDVASLIEFANEYGHVLEFFKYHIWPYGSTSYLFDIPRHGGYWVATDSKVAEQYHHSDVHATQYLFDTKWDESLIRRHAVHAYLTDNWGINH